MDSLCSTTTITAVKDSPEGHQKNQKNQLLLLSKLLHRHRQNCQKRQILNASRRSLQKLTSLSTKSLARKLLRDRRILWLLECCRKEREFIADLKAGKFQQLLPLADVDKCQEESSKENSSKAPSSLYDFEMDQLLYFSGHDSVSSLLADPLLKPIRYPADESDPQQRMLWQIYKLMDDEKEAGKAKQQQQQQQNPLPAGKDAEFCACCKTPSLETSIDQLTLNSSSTSAAAAAGYSELRRENEALRARRRRQQRQALSVEEMSAKSKERRDSRKLKRLEKKKLEEEEKVKVEEEEVLAASSSKLTTSINQSAAKPLNL